MVSRVRRKKTEEIQFNYKELLEQGDNLIEIL